MKILVMALLWAWAARSANPTDGFQRARDLSELLTSSLSPDERAKNLDMIFGEKDSLAFDLWSANNPPANSETLQKTFDGLASESEVVVRNCFAYLSAHLRQHAELFHPFDFRLPPSAAAKVLALSQSSLTELEWQGLFDILALHRRQFSQDSGKIELELARQHPRAFFTSWWLSPPTETPTENFLWARWEKIYQNLSSEEQSIFKNWKLFLDKTPFPEIVAKALQSNDPRWVQKLLHLGPDQLWKNFDESKQRAFEDLLHSRVPWLSDVRDTYLLKVRRMDRAQSLANKSLLKKWLLEKAFRDPSRSTEFKIANILDASDRDFLAQLFERNPEACVAVLKNRLEPTLDDQLDGASVPQLCRYLRDQIKANDWASGTGQELAKVFSRYCVLSYEEWKEVAAAAYERLLSLDPHTDNREAFESYLLRGPQSPKFFRSFVEESRKKGRLEVATFLHAIDVGITGDLDLVDVRKLLTELDRLPDKRLAALLSAARPSTWFGDLMKEWIQRCREGSGERAKLCQSVTNPHLAPPSASAAPSPFAPEAGKGLDWVENLLRQVSGQEHIIFEFYSSHLNLVEAAVKSYPPSPSLKASHRAVVSLILFKNRELLRKHQLLKVSDDELVKGFRSLETCQLGALRTLAKTLLAEAGKESPPKASPRPIDACNLLCRGAERMLDEELGGSVASSPFWDRRSTFSAAVNSLRLVTLYAASRKCLQSVELQSFRQALSSYVVSPQSPGEGKYGAKIARLLSRLTKKLPADSGNASEFYDLAYSKLLLKDVARGEKVTASPELTRGLEARLMQSLGDPRFTSDAGSLMNTYATAAGLSALDKGELQGPQGKALLETLDKVIREAPSPQALPYNPVPARYSSEPTGKNPERGGIARSLSLHAALMMSDPRSEKDTQHAQHLLKSLDLYFLKYFEDLSAHLQRSGTHIGADNLAPYYLYPSLFYSAYAFEALGERVKGDAAKEKRLQELRRAALEKISSLMTGAGKFKLTGDEEKQDQSSYTGFYGADQALGLRALVPLADCAEKSPARSPSIGESRRPEHE